MLIIILLNVSKSSQSQELLPKFKKRAYFHAKQAVTRLKAAPNFRREQWLFIERADVLCARLGMRNKAGETTRIVFFGIRCFMEASLYTTVFITGSVFFPSSLFWLHPWWQMKFFRVKRHCLRPNSRSWEFRSYRYLKNRLPQWSSTTE